MKSTDKTKYDENVLNWEELNNIGLSRQFLEKDGNLKLLLNGEETKPVKVNVTIMTKPQEVEATLRLVEEEKTIFLEVNGFSGNIA